jgi:excisionase family DNA binding protein
MANRHVRDETDAGTSDTDRSGLRYLTVAEAAAMMRVSKMTVYRLVHAGDLPSIRVGRSFRVPLMAVRRKLDAEYYPT